MRLTVPFVFLILLLSIAACKKPALKGEKKENQAPETYTVVDTIIRTGADRLTSQVLIQWWGDDPDGFISGFEISFDNVNYTRVKGQDSLFSLNLPEGKDTADFEFYVRAIDNEERRDPTPARLRYPVKNSPPNVSFVYSTVAPTRNPVRTFPVVKYFWTGSDPDGEENLDHFELYWNDTNAAPFIINATIREAIFSAADLSGTTTLANVFAGFNTTNPLPDQISGMKLNAENILYIRSVDKVSAKSAFVASIPIFIKKPLSDVLFVNALNNSSNLAIQNFFGQRLINAGISTFDTLKVTERNGNNYTELSPDNVTQSKVFALFKKILWFGDDASYSLSLAQRTSGEFFSKGLGTGNGGRMFMSLTIAGSFDEQSNFLDFTPVQSLVTPPVGLNFRLATDSLLTPSKSGWPVLKASNNVNSARPFNLALSNSTYQYDSLYSGSITVTNAATYKWPGVSAVIAKRTHIASAQVNFIFSSVPLDRFNGSGNADQFFQKALIEELKF